jgi:hypothetical protein
MAQIQTVKAIRSSDDHSEVPHMRLNLISRCASVLVALGYIVACIAYRGRLTSEALLVALVLLMPLALIWFPDVFGDYIGPVRGGYVDTPTPPVLIVLAGWFFLIGLPLILFFIRRSG